MVFLRQPFMDPDIPGYDDWQDPSQSTTPGNPAPPGVPGGEPPVQPPEPEDPSGGGGGGLGSFNPGAFAGASSPTFGFKPVPQFKAPMFQRPSFDEALAEPGYQFRLHGGADALERSAAARGTLRTGGTLKDLMQYGQNFAAQEYGNVFNRALNVYDREYQGAKDEFAPKYGEWQMLSGAEKARALAQFQREWDMYSFGNLSAAQREAIISGVLME